MSVKPNLGLPPPPLATPVLAGGGDQFGIPNHLREANPAPSGPLHSAWQGYHTASYNWMRSLPCIRDTHANRVNYPAEAYFQGPTQTDVAGTPTTKANGGMLYAETDTGALYQVALVANVPTWVYLTGDSAVLQAALPALLTANDAGYTVRVSDFLHRLTWYSPAVTGAVWAAGSATLTIAAPNPFIVGQSVLVENMAPAGYSGTFAVTVVTPTTVVYVVANPGAFVSGGTVSGWSWAAGDDGSGQVIEFWRDPAPTTGWQLLDGTDHVKLLTSAGTLIDLTGATRIPDLVSAANKAAYLKMGSPVAGPTAAAAPGFTGGGAGVTGSSVTGDTIPTNTGNNSATQVVQSGTGITVAANPHTHPEGVVTSPGHTHTIPAIAGTVDATGEPRNLVLRPWIRL